MSELAPWDSFCVIVGSAAGALIGLQFVVMTLIAERPPLREVAPGRHAACHFPLLTAGAIPQEVPGMWSHPPVFKHP